MSRVPVTVVLPVKNEERQLAACLERLRRFHSVMVVDSSSTDRTPQIARDFGARYVNFQWNGQFPKKRNWVLRTQTFETPWVLFLDADEFVDDAFCDAVAEALAKGGHAGYWLNYTNWFLGRRLKYGVPQRKLALFRVGSALYERIDEQSWSRLDMEVHEHPIVEGQVGEIRARIDHRDDRGISRFVERHREYAAWEAARLTLLARSGPEVWKRLTVRQRFKYRHLGSWWYPWFCFGYQYLFRLGFLDGSAGFHHAFYKLWYFLTARLLLAELRRSDADHRSAWR